MCVHVHACVRACVCVFIYLVFRICNGLCEWWSCLFMSKRVVNDYVLLALQTDVNKEA